MRGVVRAKLETHVSFPSSRREDDLVLPTLANAAFPLVVERRQALLSTGSQGRVSCEWSRRVRDLVQWTGRAGRLEQKESRPNEAPMGKSNFWTCALYISQGGPAEKRHTWRGCALGYLSSVSRTGGRIKCMGTCPNARMGVPESRPASDIPHFAYWPT